MYRCELYPVKVCKLLIGGYLLPSFMTASMFIASRTLFLFTSDIPSSLVDVVAQPVGVGICGVDTNTDNDEDNDSSCEMTSGVEAVDVLCSSFCCCCCGDVLLMWRLVSVDD